MHDHKEKGVVRDWRIGVMFVRGELWLPDLDGNFRFLPGHLMFSRACVVNQFVRSTVVEKRCLCVFLAIQSCHGREKEVSISCL